MMMLVETSLLRLKALATFASAHCGNVWQVMTLLAIACGGDADWRQTLLHHAECA